MQTFKNINAFHGVAEDALWIINTQDYKESAIYRFEPRIFHPNVRMFMTAMGRVPGEPTYTVVQREFINGGDFDFQPTDYSFPISHIYVYALLNWKKKKQRGQSTHFLVGEGDGEKGIIEGDAATKLQLELLSGKPSTRDLKEHERNTVFLPFPNITELAMEGYLRAVVLTGKAGVRFSFEHPATRRPAVQKNTTIHVIDHFNVGQSPLLSVMRAKEDDGYLASEKLTNDVGILAAFIHPEKEGTDDYIFQLGDPEKDGTIKMRTV